MNFSRTICYAALFYFSFLLPPLSYASTQNEATSQIPNGIYTYRESVGDTSSTYTWEPLPDSNSQLLIKVIEPNRVYDNICSLDGATTEWRLKEEGKHDFTAKRENNTIHIQGTLFGKKTDKIITIDDRPWFQPLSYSLGKFLESDKKSETFWVLRADTIEVISLKATRKGEEIIPIEGKKEASEVVDIRAEGFKGKFWHATYWFRKSDKLFLQYKSIHGGPGTPETVIDLISSPNDHNQIGQKAPQEEDSNQQS